MLDKRCPHCQQMISINTLKTLGTHKDFINRQPVHCPHCDKSIVLPASAEKLISTGLLFCVILAPLFYYWVSAGVITGILFAIGLLTLITGIIKNQPQPAPETEI